MEGLLLSKDILSLIDCYLTLKEVGRLITVTKKVYKKHRHTHPRVGCFANFYGSVKDDCAQTFSEDASIQTNKAEVYEYLNDWIRQKMDEKRRSDYALNLIFCLFWHTRDLKMLWGIFYPLPEIPCERMPDRIGEFYAKSGDYDKCFDEPLRMFNALRKTDRFSEYISDMCMYCGMCWGGTSQKNLQFVVDYLIEDIDNERISKMSMGVLSLCTIVYARPAYMQVACYYSDDIMDMLCFELCKRQGTNHKISNDFSSLKSLVAVYFREHIAGDPEVFLAKAIKYGNIPMIREIRAMINNRPPTDKMLLKNYPTSKLSAEFVYEMVQKRPRKEAINLLKHALNKNKKSKHV